MLIPNVCRTWAPRGQTPILRHFYRRERISAISSLTISPKRRHVALYFRFQGRNINTFDVATFLRHLLRHLRGHVILLWDKARIHRGKPIRNLLDRYPRLHVEWFPGYAPELNPAEFVWTQAKRSLANSSPEGAKELKRMLGGTARRLQRSQRLLWSCIWASALPWKR
jgi:transposase